LYPFIDWHSNGAGLFDFWSDPSSKYISRLDIWLNVCGYVPLGALWVWRWHPKPSGIVAVFMSCFICSLLSFTLESLQTFLPSRVPSQLDWYTNTFGAFMGAVIAVVMSPNVLAKTKIVKWYRTSFSEDSSFGIALCFLWGMAIIFPQPYWFSLGSWVAQLEDADFLNYIITYYQSIWIYVYNFLPNSIMLAPVDKLHMILIPFVIVFNVCGMLWSITFTMRKNGIWFYIFTILSLCLVKLVSLSFYLSILYLSIPQEVWVGLGISIVLLIIMHKAKPIVKGIFSIIFLILALFFSNVLPHNLYHEEIIETWQNSPYSHMVGLFKWLALLLPWFAMLWCVNKIIRLTYDGKSTNNEEEELNSDEPKPLKKYKSRKEKELEKQQAEQEKQDKNSENAEVTNMNNNQGNND
jgi:VanZ family protein